MKKYILVVALIVSVFILFKVLQPNSGELLSISGPFEFKGQDLSTDGFLFSRLQVTEALVEVTPDGELRPLLATDWSEDGAVWRFTIRAGVSFHNGEELGAETVARALQQAAARPGVIQKVPIQEIRAEGNQVVIELSRDYRPLASVLAHYSTAISSLETLSGGPLKGTGPYQVEKLSPPHKLEVLRYPGYWGKKARIERVQYLAGHRSESRALLVKTGEADLAYTLDPTGIESLQEDKKLTIKAEALPRTVLLKLNNAHPFLEDKETRQAISLALDRGGIAREVLRLPGAEAYQLFSPALGSWHLSNPPRARRDLERARELLTARGWAVNSAGLLERDGQVFELNLTTYADRPELPLIATALQAQLREVGIDINITIDNSGAIPLKHNDGSLELALIARNFGTIANPLALLLSDFGSYAGSEWGPMNWSSPRMSSLLSELSRGIGSGAPGKEQQAAQEVAEILAEEMPLIPLTFYTQLIAVNNRVQNFRFDPFEINYYVADMHFR
ncbi:ABC transporter substrate-binding protein [Candidatus Haliotispira prima]|uniref:ABC transporter substrate-binding protein n=1 Tax=Candidatus Haliotispira prima TaxID=3034016 RepID=A0ABY8MFD1_9SPIO|nr:ABC transporter substrate-binding protein [Candidatus Haliotispira prima]